MSTVLIFFFLVEAPIASRVRVLATKPSPPVHPCTGCPRLQRVAAISKENPQTILGIALFPFRPALQGPSEMRPNGLGGIRRLRKNGASGLLLAPLYLLHFVGALVCFFPRLFVCLFGGFVCVCVSFYFFSFTMFFELTRDARSPPRCGRREGREQDRELSGSAEGAGGWPDLLRVFIFPLFLYLFTRSLFLGVILP